MCVGVYRIASRYVVYRMHHAISCTFSPLPHPLCAVPSCLKPSNSVVWVCRLSAHGTLSHVSAHRTLSHAFTLSQPLSSLYCMRSLLYLSTLTPLYLSSASLAIPLNDSLSQTLFISNTRYLKDSPSLYVSISCARQAIRCMA